MSETPSNASRCIPKLIRLVFRGQLSIWDIDGDLAAGEVTSARPARAR